MRHLRLLFPTPSLLLLLAATATLLDVLRLVRLHVDVDPDVLNLLLFLVFPLCLLQLVSRTTGTERLRPSR